MSDLQIRSRPVLAAKAELAGDGIRIAPLPEGLVLQILGRPGDNEAAEALMTFGDEGYSLRSAAPGQWFLVGDTPFDADALTALVARLPAGLDAMDQSHGRVRILIEGRFVEAVLAKGTAVDLAAPAFPVGHATTALVSHIPVHFTRLSEEAFELMVLRSFAESLWHDLSVMAAEYLSEPMP